MEDAVNVVIVPGYRQDASSTVIQAVNQTVSASFQVQTAAFDREAFVYADYVEEIQQLVDDRSILIGHSLGGTIALNEGHKGYVESVVALDPLARVTDVNGDTVVVSQIDCEDTLVIGSTAEHIDLPPGNKHLVDADHFFTGKGAVVAAMIDDWLHNRCNDQREKRKDGKGGRGLTPATGRTRSGVRLRR